MSGKKGKMASRKSAASPDLAPIPDCEGPKLQAYPGQTNQIEWLGRLDEHRDVCSSSSTGSEGYVFKVRIDSKLYALKVVSGVFSYSTGQSQIDHVVQILQR